jgi:hypothetical protein
MRPSSTCHAAPTSWKSDGLTKAENDRVEGGSVKFLQVDGLALSAFNLGYRTDPDNLEYNAAILSGWCAAPIDRRSEIYRFAAQYPDARHRLHARQAARRVDCRPVWRW